MSMPLKARARQRCLNISRIFSHVPSRSIKWLGAALTLMILLSVFSFARIYNLSVDSVLHKIRPSKQPSEPPPPPKPWEIFDPLTRYWGGLRALEPASARVPEYPYAADHPALTEGVSPDSEKLSSAPDPYPFPYNPRAAATKLPFFNTPGEVQECYLDAEETIPIQPLQAYRGLVKGFPDPITGSYATLGLDNDFCFERYGRLGPYGYGYSTWQGGVGGGTKGDRNGVDAIWESVNQTDFRKVDWAGAQERCYRKNLHRFAAESATIPDDWETLRSLSSNNTVPPQPNTNQTASKVPRSAVIFRVWDEYDWTNEAIIRMRSLITELSLLSGGEYQVHFLVHIKDDSLKIWESEQVYQKTLKRSLPAEFEGMGTLWSEPRMREFYPGLEETKAAGLPVHGVYRSAHFPVQWFSQLHPEYEYVWNWEMDIRYTGHWYTLFETLRSFARGQPRKGLWERNGRFYVPTVHGSWAEFTQMVKTRSEQAAADDNATMLEPPIWGPEAPPGTVPFPSDPTPPHSHEDDQYEWGMDEEADLITLNPIFNPIHTQWVLQGDVTGYNHVQKPPRRVAIVTASRLSRRLLRSMHAETALHKHTMFAEMWPTSVALHHGLKAVYAPHPVYEDRAWPPAVWEQKFNGGANGAAGGGAESLFGIELDRNFYGTTWYFHAKLSQKLWRRWLGVPADEMVVDHDELREGRMCLPPILLHPVKPIKTDFPL